MSSEETVILVAGIAATLQVFRVSVDLVSTASHKDSIVDKKLEDATRDELRASIAANSKTKRQPSARFFDGRFSMAQQQRASKTTATKYESDEVLVDDELVAVEEIEETKPTASMFQQRLIGFSGVLNVTLCIYFTVACILESVNAVPSGAIYTSFPLGCTAAFFFLSSIVSLRDYPRARFTNIQRTLHFSSSILIALGIIFPLAMRNDKASSTKSMDIIASVILALYAILAVLEVKFIQLPVEEVETKAHKKARLSMKAIIIVLKPYFWPEATSSSATLNRARALATYGFVILAKACGLLAPIYLGRASTELTRQNYKACIYNVIYFNVLTLAGAIFKEAQSLVYLRVAQAAFVQLAELSFSHLHSLSLDWHLQKKLGEVIRSMDRGILACDVLIKYLFLWMLPAIAECILVAVIFAVYFSDLLLGVTIFYFVFAYMILTVLLTLWRKKFRKQVSKSDNDWHDIATDSLINFETVKYFTSERYEMKKFGAAVETFQKGSVNVAASLSALNISQRVLLQTCLAVSLSLTALGIKDRMDCCIANGCDDGNSECCSNLSDVCKGMEIGDFVAVLTYTINLFTPLNFLGSVYNAIVMALVDLTNLSELLAENPDIEDAKDAIDLPKANSIDDDTVVEFDNVKFHYPSQPESNGLQGVSFKMKKGTTTAIVGSTGAGKTTLSRLLFRFYDVNAGSVKVNGVDIRTVKQKDLRDKIGVVPQSTTLFNDTLGANIKYGNQEATDTDLEEAAKAAQLTSFVDSLPDKWNTMVGDRGLKLSGGEKQRTAIARCILKNPSICIFDEATSALDTLTEASVKEALDRLGNDRTVLVIAHRLGTIKNSDNIIVLSAGRIAEEGTHEELIALGGQYAEMWQMQLMSTRSGSSATLGLTTDKPL